MSLFCVVIGILVLFFYFGFVLFLVYFVLVDISLFCFAAFLGTRVSPAVLFRRFLGYASVSPAVFVPLAALIRRVLLSGAPRLYVPATREYALARTKIKLSPQNYDFSFIPANFFAFFCHFFPFSACFPYISRLFSLYFVPIVAFSGLPFLVPLDRLTPVVFSVNFQGN